MLSTSNSDLERKSFGHHSAIGPYATYRHCDDGNTIAKRHCSIDVSKRQTRALLKQKLLECFFYSRRSQKMPPARVTKHSALFKCYLFHFCLVSPNVFLTSLVALNCIRQSILVSFRFFAYLNYCLAQRPARRVVLPLKTHLETARALLI